MKKRNCVQRIMEGKSREIAWQFFKEYNNPTTITRTMYEKPLGKNKKSTAEKYNKASKKSSWQMPNITLAHKEWKNEGFFYIEKLEQPTIRRNSPLTQKFTHYIFNLEPLFRYAGGKGIRFTKFQKQILEKIYAEPRRRLKLYVKYKNNNFIDAIITDYVNSLILPTIIKENYLSKENQYILEGNRANLILFPHCPEMEKEFTKPVKKILNKKLNPNSVNEKNILNIIISFPLFMKNRGGNNYTKQLKDLDDKMSKLFGLEF